jgi:hypothetical protein
MNPLVLVHHRSARRRRQGGVAMFVVTMMLTVLATVGLYALAAASTEVKTAGNERQSTQTHYLAEYGIVAIAHNADGPFAAAYLGRMTSTQVCQSLPIPTSAVTFDPLTTSCGVFDMVDFQKTGNWLIAPTVAYAGTAPYQASISTPGSLGPVPTLAGFVVELTDSNAATAPGYGLTNQTVKFNMVTATASGVTLPSFGGTSAYGNEGIETQRARIIAGPIPQ